MTDSPRHPGEQVARAILDRLNIPLAPWQVDVLLVAMDNPHGYVVAMTAPRRRSTSQLHLWVWRRREQLRRARLSSMHRAYRPRTLRRSRRAG